MPSSPGQAWCLGAGHIRRAGSCHAGKVLPSGVTPPRDRPNQLAGAWAASPGKPAHRALGFPNPRGWRRAPGAQKPGGHPLSVSSLSSAFPSRGHRHLLPGKGPSLPSILRKGCGTACPSDTWQGETPEGARLSKPAGAATGHPCLPAPRARWRRSKSEGRTERPTERAWAAGGTTLTVSFGKAARTSIRFLYICSAVPSKNRPQPPTNKVSPGQGRCIVSSERALSPHASKGGGKRAGRGKPGVLP